MSYSKCICRGIGLIALVAMTSRAINAEIRDLTKAEEQQLYATLTAGRKAVQSAVISFQMIPLGKGISASLKREEALNLVGSHDHTDSEKVDETIRQFMSERLQSIVNEKRDGRYFGGERDLTVDGNRFRLQLYNATGQESSVYVFDGVDQVSRETHFNNQITINEPRWTDKLSDLAPLTGIAGRLEELIEPGKSALKLLDGSMLIAEVSDGLTVHLSWPECNVDRMSLMKNGRVNEVIFRGYVDVGGDLQLPTVTYDLRFQGKDEPMTGAIIRRVREHRIQASVSDDEFVVAGGKSDVVVDFRAGATPKVYRLMEPVTNAKTGDGKTEVGTSDQREN